MSRIPPWWSVLVIVLTAISARAEVSLHGSELIVDGTWAPAGPITERTLNPSGDVIGDGAPAHAWHGERVLVAWTSPATSSLRLARSNGAGWESLPPIASPGAFGTPRVVVHEQGWLVAWQRDPDSPSTWLAGVPLEGTGWSGRVNDGFLAGLVGADLSFHLVTLSLDGRLESTSVVVHYLTPAYPLPISRYGGVAGLDELPTAAFIIPVYPLPIGRVPSGMRSHSLVPPFPLPIGRLPATPDIRTHSGVRADGSTFHLVTWWKTPTLLRYAELTELGAADTRSIRSLAAYSETAVSRAIADVRGD